MAVIGYAGVPINCATVDVSFNGVTVVKRGVGMPLKEREAARVLRRPFFQVKVRLGQGEQATSICTADLSHEYVRINSAYRHVRWRGQNFMLVSELPGLLRRVGVPRHRGLRT
jgi:glutamate N-acetyltransferase / amino-acid N-acetyltransferase